MASFVAYGLESIVNDASFFPVVFVKSTVYVTDLHRLHRTRGGLPGVNSPKAALHYEENINKKKDKIDKNTGFLELKPVAAVNRHAHPPKNRAVL